MYFGNRYLFHSNMYGVLIIYTLQYFLPQLIIFAHPKLLSTTANPFRSCLSPFPIRFKDLPVAPWIWNVFLWRAFYPLRTTSDGYLSRNLLKADWIETDLLVSVSMLFSLSICLLDCQQTTSRAGIFKQMIKSHQLSFNETQFFFRA